MYQHIGVTAISETGTRLDSIELNFAPVLSKLEELNDYKNRYPWLTTIDPYGDTTVNAPQREHFISELEVLKSEIGDTVLVEIVDKTIDRLNALGAHEYLKFIGD